MKKMFGLLFAGMLCVSMVGCGDDVQEQVKNGYNDATQEEQQVEAPKDEAVEPEPVEEPAPVQENKAFDAEGAYELLKPVIAEQFGTLDHEFTIMDGDLMLIGYLPAEEVYYGIKDGSWNDLVANAEFASNNFNDMLEQAGYTGVAFNISMCDSVKRQDLCYLVVRNGITAFNVADHLEQ